MIELTTYELFVLAAGAMAFGLYLLIKGGDWTVDAAVFVAERTGLSPLFIGATIVSFGTSVPELFTSVNANLQGYPGISLGNVLGSNVANILLVLGATAFIFKVTADPKHLMKDLAMMLLATAIMVYGMLTDSFSQIFGLIMFAILVTFVVYQYKTDSIVLEEDDDDEETLGITTMKGAVIVLLGGLAALAVGSELLVKGAVQTGTAIGVPEAVIGMTVVAFGTSLPELSTCIAAARKQSVGLILGNIIGSNTFNILSIIALTAVIKPLDVDPVLLGMELWVTVAVAVLFAVWMLVVGRITKPVGIVMMLGYVVFIAAQYLQPQMVT
ncbi:calcium/sodium antiporter [Yoonia sp. F2084L]|uniref:calcium/sodium antiporter n=1 Tax=Yoonia sp. F2084L TaxID=2926419 RepID=UPI001FF45720|nr:calcium/sodium antiporter [Yoonia sp. F2084L]MCK0094462.1 calcium/sodium antiporter [Yoonia sp. F2084L]